jgi:hypothetical protein
MLYASVIVSAATHYVDQYCDTTVNSDKSLDANVAPWTFSDLEMDANDNVNIKFTLSYVDNRAPASSPTAYHYWNITAYYDDGTTLLYKYADGTKTTTGGENLDADISVQFNSVQVDKYINVTLLARVTLGLDVASDTIVEHPIHLVDNV